MIKTKQELLNHFSDINAMYNNPFMYQTLSNMIDELLEQPPCGDCISREETLNKINELIAEYIPLMPTGWTIAKTINELPPVKPQPKVGHWVEMELVDTGVSKFSCSVCKEGDFYNQIDNPFIPTKYCPNCGAKMKKGKTK